MPYRPSVVKIEEFCSCQILAINLKESSNAESCMHGSKIDWQDIGRHENNAARAKKGIRIASI